MKTVFDIAFHVEHECHADHVSTDALIEALRDRLHDLVKNPDGDAFGRPDWAKVPCVECKEPADQTPCGEYCAECFKKHKRRCRTCREWYKAGEAAAE